MVSKFGLWLSLTPFVPALKFLLDLFRQKIFVFVEVSGGLEKPFALTVVNRSRFEVSLESLNVDPDGFPDDANGLILSQSCFLKNQLLLPGQRIRFFLSSSDVGAQTKRRFRAQYSTLLWRWKVPRSVQVADAKFDLDAQMLRVRSSSIFK